MANEALVSGSFWRSRWAVLLYAGLLPCLYLPTLATRFDFADDGVLVYSSMATNTTEHLTEVWRHTLSDYRTSGPFRPLTWLHWDTAARLLGPHDFSHRLLRWCWSVLATVTLVWLMLELELNPGAVLLATALGLYNPWRGEIWLGLGLTEAFAMPYAVLALVCALRGSRSPRPLGWDVGGVLCLLAALCVKNTFVAVLPAGVFLRIWGGNLDWQQACRRNAWRASWYASTILLPMVHFIQLKMNPQPGQYATSMPPMQLPKFLVSLGGALNKDVILPGLILALVVLGMGWSHLAAQTNGKVLARYRLALLAGLGLVVSGIAVYIPLDAIAGRYTVPAAWGVDLWFAVLFSLLASVPLVAWRRFAFGVLLFSTAVVAMSNVGKQQKTAARNDLLWQALEFVEHEAPRQGRIAWVGVSAGSSPTELLFGEGFHFAAHLAGRGRGDLDIQRISEWHQQAQSPLYILTSSPEQPSSEYHLARAFETHYYCGWRNYQCYVWASRKEMAAKARTGSETP